MKPEREAYLDKPDPQGRARFPTERGLSRLRRGAEALILLLFPIAMTVALVCVTPTSAAQGTGAVVAAIVVPAAGSLWVVRQSGRPVSAADRMTLGRVALTGVLSGAAVLVLFSALPARTWLIAVVAAAALLLDAVDGWLARRTRSASCAGARLDMQADAALLVVLCLLAAPTVGFWVLGIGAMRYLFVAVSWFRPQLRRQLPPSRLRRPVAAVQGITMLIALIPGVPEPVGVGACVIAWTLLMVSFTRDVIALERLQTTTHAE